MEDVYQRIEEIKNKLDNIPYSDEDTIRYYIFYKEDMKWLFDMIKSGFVGCGKCGHQSELILQDQMIYRLCKNEDCSHMELMDFKRW